MNYLVAALLLVSISLNACAALVCKGHADGLYQTYTFAETGSRDLRVSVFLSMDDDEAMIELDTVAHHTSTFVSRVTGEPRAGASYYYIVYDDDSYTELVSISADKGQMAVSRPVPGASNGYFRTLSCVGEP